MITVRLMVLSDCPGEGEELGDVLVDGGLDRELDDSDAMKERASAPGGCWKVQASVSTRQGRLTMTEAYDGRQVVGIESGDARMDDEPNLAPV